MYRTTITLLILFVSWGVAVAQAPFPGETLVSPEGSTETFLVDMDGNTLKTWYAAARPASIAYMYPDGSIVRPCQAPTGFGGRVQKFDAGGSLTWDYLLPGDDYPQHHDIQPLPNGNVLIIAWGNKTQQEAIAAGRQLISGEIWPTLIVEVEPVDATGGNIVWEWSLWDHLIQDVDPSKANYGVVADHPELFDINLGSIGGSLGGGDWIHVNAIDYNERLDQIVFSSRSMDEFYIIDHSTTTTEAASHTGGASGKGGDLLYRWGNPQNYDRGLPADRYFHVIHGVNWIDCGLPGGGNILAINNGDRQGTNNDYTTAVEIATPVGGDGQYILEPGEAFGPSSPVWVFEDRDFYGGATQCGAFRLPNGNTLITAARDGYVFEVTEAGDTVWEYDHSARVARAPRYWTPDQSNHEAFAACLNGPAAVGCDTCDLDCDGDTDLDDFAAFQATFGQYTGP